MTVCKDNFIVEAFPICDHVEFIFLTSSPSKCSTCIHPKTGYAASVVLYPGNFSYISSNTDRYKASRDGS